MPGAAVDTSRPCPLCGGRRGRPGWAEAGLRYVRCASCAAFFTDVSEQRYEALRHNVWDDDEATADVLGFYGDARARPHQAFLDAHTPRGGGRLLDVGCGMGFFLERAAARGWEAWGLEPSAPWAAAARERAGVRQIVEARLDDDVLAGERFDLITVWDVLEHIYDPLPFLRRLRERLAPGGALFLRTPNLDYVLPVYRARRRAGHDVELGPLNHVVYFDARSMRRALTATGLRPQRWLALPPPQVATFSAAGERHAPRHSPTVTAKNGWARVADATARLTGGRVLLASDLDVLAERAGP